jgi:hypothetical protein
VPSLIAALAYTNFLSAVKEDKPLNYRKNMNAQFVFWNLAKYLPFLLNKKKDLEVLTNV